MANKKTYAEKLKSPKWQQKRLAIFQRDDFTCQLCGDEDSTLHVHHKEYTYGKDPWEYDNSVLVTLCEHCHSLVELIKHDEEKRTVKYVQKSPAIRDRRFMLVHMNNNDVGVYKYLLEDGSLVHIVTLREKTFMGFLDRYNDNLTKDVSDSADSY